MDLPDEILESDEEETSAAKILQLLTIAWVNEIYAPELLKHESDVVDCMMDQIKQMEENLRNLGRDDFRFVPHQMEVDRIQYVISSYLRTRMEKIETFTDLLVKRDSSVQEEDDKIMSEGEFFFAKEFLLSIEKHFYEEAGKYLPTLLRDSESSKLEMEVKPNLNSVVFIRMVKSIKGLLISDQVIELNAGSRHLLPYNEIKHLIKNGSAFLI